MPTASKGIIEKGQNVHLVSAAGPPNPFSKISEEELKTYQKEVLAGIEFASLFLTRFIAIFVMKCYIS